MKYARPDYDRIQGPAIPEDEPVFLLRGQDEIAWLLVADWAKIAKAKGVDPGMVDAARNQANAMRKWPKKKTPDMPGGK